MNRMINLRPELLKEWDYEKNKDLDPLEISSTSSKKVWWRCLEGHEWTTNVYERTKRNSNCPYCSGRKVSKDNCLQTLRPDLAKEWHPTKNGGLTPTDVTCHYSKKIWWQCSKKPEHQWESRIVKRERNSSCPYCSGKLICADSCLAITHPDLAKEWHPTKNGSLTATDVTCHYSKKIWWQCSKSNFHVWKTSIYRRLYETGCPYCSGQKVCEDNCLATTHPELAKEWHPTKNGTLTPDMVIAGSPKKAWWKCGKNPNHEWQSVMSTRKKGVGCPYCSGRLVCEDNCLVTTHPELAKEWHPTKNGTLTPETVSSGMGIKVWWKCSRNPNHEWASKISNRRNGTNCPHCNSEYKTSYPEQVIFFYLSRVFNDCRNRYVFKTDKGETFEVDIFIESLNLGIEYDGFYYHQKMVHKDIIKTEKLKNNDIDLVRIKEFKNQPIVTGDSCKLIQYKPNRDYSNITEILIILIKYIEEKYSLEHRNLLSKIDLDLSRDMIEILNLFYMSKKDLSLLSQNPVLAKEFHPTKNGNLTADLIHHGCGKKIWWICSKNPNHEWEASVFTRKKGVGCPYCAGRKICLDNCLETTNPNLAKEFHPTKNGELTTFDVMSGSNKKVWWQCSKNPSHEWEAVIQSRNRGVGCPYCSNRKVSKDNCFAATHTELAKQWHLTKNGDLTPENVTFGSHKKVWWQCPNNENHVWLCTIHNRKKIDYCPYCAGKLKSPT